MLLLFVTRILKWFHFHKHDNYTDQLTRLFLFFILIASSGLSWVVWFNGRVSCYLPPGTELSVNYVNEACWIQGFYIYSQSRANSSYYGIPMDIEHDGQTAGGDHCKAESNINTGCQPMKKTFYLHYQWLPFFITALVFLVYTPHFVFRLLNSDMISFRESISQISGNTILPSYFSACTKNRDWVQVGVGCLAKLVYVIVMVVAFLSTNHLLLDNFKDYGLRTLHQLNDETTWNTVNPGEILLPSYGICEVPHAYEHVKVVCKIPSHDFHQPVFLVVWYSMCLAAAAAVLNCLLHVLSLIWAVENARAEHVRGLSVRECEYLLFVKNQNTPLYNEILSKLKHKNWGRKGSGCHGN